MITDNDVKKLKQTFVTKEDLEESESRTAFGFADVQKQLNVLTTNSTELKDNVAKLIKGQSSLEKRQSSLERGQAELKEEVKEIKLQMYGMEQNIIAAIHEIKEDHEVTKKRVTKLEKIALAN